jgi:hypothetical protein
MLTNWIERIIILLLDIFSKFRGFPETKVVGKAPPASEQQRSIGNKRTFDRLFQEPASQSYDLCRPGFGTGSKAKKLHKL